MMPYERPLIIIAAARSGTKMLRQLLAASNEISDFPYDMNYIWKYGNYSIPHDALTVEDITPRITNFIRSRFKNLFRKTGAPILLEKSVSNSLRVEFVKKLFPGAKIIHLFRDGRDVTADARLCWQDSAFSDRIQSKNDLLHKLREFPYLAAWPYLAAYARLYLARTINRKDQVESWGPRFEGIDTAIETKSLIEVCALQWAKCIDSSLGHLSNYTYGSDYIDVRYETLVTYPGSQVERIAEFAGIRNPDPIHKRASDMVSADFVGFWRKHLIEQEVKDISPIISKQMTALGYPTIG